jgi:hypothetical protein
LEGELKEDFAPYRHGVGFHLALLRWRQRNFFNNAKACSQIGGKSRLCAGTMIAEYPSWVNEHHI